MLRNSLRRFSFLLVGLLLAGCASQKFIPPDHAVESKPALNSGQPIQQADQPMAEKPAVVPLSQPPDAEKGVKPAAETGPAMEPTPVALAEPAPEMVSITLMVQFDTGKANIKAEYHQDLKSVADFMGKYPATSAVIVGHTDNLGKEAVNVKLSYRRADAIRTYLVEKFGIDRSRIRAIGYDYRQPVASNKTAEGRQKNRRGETRIEANVPPNRLYSYFEDSDFPKGGFSIVNQESIDAQIKSFQEKQGVASYLSKTVQAPTLELYKMWGGVFSHCAIRIEAEPGPFYQVELQSVPDLKKAGIAGYHRTWAAMTLLGITADQMDIVEFTDKNERTKLDAKEPPYATMPICMDTKSTKKTARWYRDCLSRYAQSYNPEHSPQAGKRTKVFAYNPVTHNCCNFAEEALKACGLAHCFDLGKSTGLDHKAGPLEESTSR